MVSRVRQFEDSTDEDPPIVWFSYLFKNVCYNFLTVKNYARFSLWSMKNILPSEWTRSSQPSGNGPKSSSGFLLTKGTVAWLGIGLARPVRGSTHDVVLSLWSMKKSRPFGATWTVHPGGRPSDSNSKLLELLVVETVESRRDELFDRLSVWSSLWKRGGCSHWCSYSKNNRACIL